MKFSKRTPIYLMMLLGLFIFGGWYFGVSEKEARYGRIALAKVQPSQVSISWNSAEPESGSVRYYPMGRSDDETKITQAPGVQVREHQVTINGLKPGTRYAYAIGDSKKTYHFQTQPEPGAAFSFMVLWGDAVARAGDYLLSEMPSFYLLLSDPAEQQNAPLEDIQPYVPFFSYSDGSVFRLYQGRVGLRTVRTSNLQWAGFSLEALDEISSEADNADPSATHTKAVIIPAERLADQDGPCSVNRACVAQSAMHAALLAYNRKNSDRPVNFVLITGQAMIPTEVDAIQYLGLPTEHNPDSAIRVDVHGESVYAVAMDTNKEIVLKAPPLKQYRTCEDCRRLATRGAYQESIAAYRKFITQNNDHYQLDDAYYAIAEIQDTKLFRYKDAIDGYQKLATRYPESALTPLASQRIAFIRAHADHGYEPLKRFESIKRTTSGRNDATGTSKLAVLGEAEQILVDFPGSTLAPKITFWLAHQYRSVSAEKAIQWYKQMMERFPAHPDAQKVWWDIGLVYYEAEQYTHALEAFRKAKAQQPTIEKEIDIQIQRVKRNQFRVVVLWACRFLIAFLVAIPVLKKPMGLDGRSLWIAMIIFLSLGSIYATAAWLIHEQFTSLREIILLVGGFSALVSLGYPVSRAFTNKLILLKAEKRMDTAAGSMSSIIVHSLFIAAGAYQILYHANRHYLVILGL